MTKMNMINLNEIELENVAGGQAMAPKITIRRGSLSNALFVSDENDETSDMVSGSLQKVKEMAPKITGMLDSLTYAIFV